MHFVNGNWCRRCLARSALLHPVAVGPEKCPRFCDYRRGGWRRFGGAGDWIGFERKKRTIRAHDLVFVPLTSRKPRNEHLPEPRRVTKAHGVTPPVPCIEIADHRDAARVRRPNGESHARNSLDRVNRGTQAIRQIPVRSLCEEKEIHVAQDGTEGVRVLGFLYAIAPLYFQEIACFARDRPGKRAGIFHGLQTAKPLAAVARQHLDSGSARKKGAYDGALRRIVRTKPGERIGKLSPFQRSGGRTITRAENERVHANIPWARSIRAARPLSGMSIQSGR